MCRTPEPPGVPTNPPKRAGVVPVVVQYVSQSVIIRASRPTGALGRGALGITVGIQGTRGGTHAGCVVWPLRATPERSPAKCMVSPSGKTLAISFSGNSVVVGTQGSLRCVRCN